MSRISKRSKKILCYIIGALVLTTGTMMLAMPQLFGFDINAAETRQGEDPPTEAQLQEALQKEVDKSMFRVILNTQPVFESPAEQGDLLIKNSMENKLDMRVVITLNDTGEVVYESQVLSPGGDELYGKLEKALEAGEYPATATSSALDPETGEVVGTVQSEMMLKIQNT